MQLFKLQYITKVDLKTWNSGNMVLMSSLTSDSPLKRVLGAGLVLTCSEGGGEMGGNFNEGLLLSAQNQLSETETQSLGKCVG